jgi:hypothetical protein
LDCYSALAAFGQCPLLLRNGAKEQFHSPQRQNRESLRCGPESTLILRSFSNGVPYGRRQETTWRSRPRKVSGSEPYEVAYFAKKHGITQAQTKELIKKHGNDRKKLDAAAKRLSGK